MAGTFYKCSNLKEIKLSNFNTSNVIDMVDMFSFCKNLDILDITNFDFKNVKSMKNMFLGTSGELQTKVKEQNNGLRAEAFP